MATVAEAMALALQHHQAGHLTQAEQLYRHILQADPGNAEALHYLGVLAHQAGRHDLAVELIRRSLQLKPGNGPACNNLGLALQAQGRKEEALASFRQALEFWPTMAAAYCNLAGVLLGLGRVDEAVTGYRQALLLDPDSAQLHNSLSLALESQGQIQDAEAHARQAVRLNPHYADAHDQLGSVLRVQERLDEAAACYEEALRLDPDSAGAHFNLAVLQLMRGDFARGWPGFEWRLRSPAWALPPLPGPYWDGSLLGGKTILLFADQGAGDVLQFIRYAPLVKERGGHIVVACDAALMPLLQCGSGIDQCVNRSGPLPAFDVHAALLSLPAILGTTLATIPAQVPYLKADPTLVARWKERLAHPSAFNVGICWQGNPDHRNDRRRSVPLSAFAPLAGVPGVRLVNLQYGPGRDQLAEMKEQFQVTNWLEQTDPGDSPWVESAALVKALDLIVTVDTAVAHLAGALGMPVWVALPSVVCWRWLLEREDSPWYPTMRLFRQQQPGDWSGVFERIAEALSGMASGSEQQSGDESPHSKTEA
jgi:tetratricopeptide (TPR) repeat protein